MDFSSRQFSDMAVWEPVEELPVGIGRLRTVAPVAPYRSVDLGEVDLQCVHCGSLLLSGWNYSGMQRIGAIECWKCRRASVFRNPQRGD